MLWILIVVLLLNMICIIGESCYIKELQKSNYEKTKLLIELNNKIKERED